MNQLNQQNIYKIIFKYLYFNEFGYYLDNDIPTCKISVGI